MKTIFKSLHLASGLDDIEGEEDEEDQVPVLEIDVNYKHLILISFCEIYNEEISDLLEISKKKLKIIEKNKSIFVQGIAEKTVHSLKDAMDWVELGRNNRKTAETKLNVDSSRSHCIFTIKICKIPKNVDKELIRKVIFIFLFFFYFLLLFYFIFFNIFNLFNILESQQIP